MKSNLVFKNVLIFPFLEELMDETGPPEADNELAVDVQDKYFKFESPAPDQMGTKKQIVVKSDKNSPNIFRFGSAPPKVNKASDWLPIRSLQNSKMLAKKAKLI